MGISDARANDLLDKPKTSKLRLTMKYAFTIAKYAAFCAAIVIFMGQSQRSMDPLIAWISDVVEPLGLVVVVALPLIVGAYRSIVRKDFSQLAYSAGGVLAGLALYSFVLWALGKYGVLAKLLIIQHPAESVAVTLALLICWILARVALRTDRTAPTKSSIQPGRTSDHNLIESKAAV